MVEQEYLPTGAAGEVKASSHSYWTLGIGKDIPSEESS